ncbi:MAG: sucrose-phosphate phosphatase [Acidobacteria bacterium]|nr:sucrose-phosphate phosphatase [Acidobacteriota bacterium]
MTEQDGLYIALISVHGLIRGSELELGRDADTGGQVRYVLDLARALATHPQVERVDLLTRQILAVSLGLEYSEHLEEIGDNAWIVRLPCGPHRYLRKESLWPYLPEFVDHALRHFREIGRAPDVIHGHYADAGGAAARLSALLNSTLVFTGHSLGRVKQARLLEKGVDPEQLENRYKITRRINAEENVLQAADLIVASTEQEVDEQYAMYRADVRARAAVIPPGISLAQFRPPRAGDARPAIADKIDRFLRYPRRPMILALQRPDERKNLTTLIHAYGGSEELQRLANLVLMIGTRDDIGRLPGGQRRVLQEMLGLIDRYDLYGSVAYPKSHAPEDVPDVYRLAARRSGVLVNPALTEPFGLTLIEAAASGLPVVATRDGGPKAIVDLCKNGVLIDPLDPDSIAGGLLDVLGDRQQWRGMSRAGVRGARRHFSWQGHVERYLKRLRRVRRRRHGRRRDDWLRDRMVLADRMIVCDIDNTLIGNEAALRRFLEVLEQRREETIFAVATGRVLKSARKVLRKWGVPAPDVMITAVGSEIHYGQVRLVEDVGWARHIAHRWERDRLRRLLEQLPDLELQPDRDQRQFKLSYFVDRDKAPIVRHVRRLLKQNRLSAQVIYSHDAYLDLLPHRASKGEAVRYLALRWGLHLESVLGAGDSGNDAEMFRIGAKGVVVGNHARELEALRGTPNIYFAQADHADGIVEGMRYFGFLDDTAQASVLTREEPS